MSEVVYQSESADRAWVDRLPHAPARYAAGVLALAGLYYAGAKTGYLLEFSGPGSGDRLAARRLGIAFLYLGGLAYWPGRADRRPARQRLLGAAIRLGARPDLRELSSRS
jgi:hypothetical protein